MKTLTVDAHKRVRIPDARPKAVYAYENHGDGTIILTELKPVRKMRFPKGSLIKYFTGKIGRERDELETALLRGTVQGPE